MRSRLVPIFLLATLLASAQEAIVEIAALPESIEGFLELRDAQATRPEGAAAVFLSALILYSQNPTLGEQAVIVCLTASQLGRGEGYQGYALGASPSYLLKRLAPGAQDWIARSYVLESKSETAYLLPEGPLRFALGRNSSSGSETSGRIKLFVASSGADTPRPLTLERNSRGIWKVAEWSSLSVGVRAPEAEKDEL